MYKFIFMSQAQKDAKTLASSGLKNKFLKLLKIIKRNLFTFYKFNLQKNVIALYLLYTNCQLRFLCFLLLSDNTVYTVRAFLNEKCLRKLPISLRAYGTRL